MICADETCIDISHNVFTSEVDGGDWALGLGAKAHQVEALEAFWAQHTATRFTFLYARDASIKAF